MKTYEQLMSERIGFARDVTGGVEPYVVDNLDDSGQGSLRYGAALGGRFITADPGLVGTIPVPTAIDVEGDTLIALGPSINLLRTGDLHHGLRLRGPNTGVTYTRLDGAHDGVHENGSDGIRIEATATDLIWVSHCHIWDWADGAVDTETHDAITIDRLSICWNRINNTRLAINLWAHRVSFGYNRVADCGGRGPKITGGKLHAYNNLTKRWEGSNIRQTGGQGQLHSDFDMWIVGDGGNKIGTPEGPIRHNLPFCFDATVTYPGDNGVIDPAFIAEARANSGFTAISQSGTAKQIKDRYTVVRQRVEAEAGTSNW